MSQICILNTIRENEIHAKISVFIVIVAEGFFVSKIVSFNVENVSIV